MKRFNGKLITIISSLLLLCGLAACGSYSIEGTVTGDTVKSIEIALTGDASNNTTTDSAGEYSFSGLEAGTYTITPGLAGVTFDPENIEEEITDADITGIDFTATGTDTGTATQTNAE